MTNPADETWSAGTADVSRAARQIMDAGDRAAWSCAALALGMSGRGTPAMRRAIEELLRALDVVPDPGADPDSGLSRVERMRVAAQASAPLLQTAALLGGDTHAWAAQSDEALQAQGHASAQGVGPFAQFILPRLEGLTSLLHEPGARMLDVGTGVAALAVAYAERFPAMTVVGLDVLPRVLELAAATVAASTVAERVILRQQDVSTLDEDSTYALAWLPAPFLPEPALAQGLPRVARAVVPGGWVMVGHGKYAGDPVEDALTGFKTVAYGGTALDDPQAKAVLREAGFIDVMTLPTPPGAPAVTVGRKAPS